MFFKYLFRLFVSCFFLSIIYCMSHFSIRISVSHTHTPPLLSLSLFSIRSVSDIRIHPAPLRSYHCHYFHSFSPPNRVLPDANVSIDITIIVHEPHPFYHTLSLSMSLPSSVSYHSPLTIVITAHQQQALISFSLSYVVL